MKKNLSFLSNVLFSSMLLLGAATVGAEESVFRVPADAGSYCHMKFPTMLEETLNWEKPTLDEGGDKVVDFYGSCDYDPTGIDAINAQRRILNRGAYGDSE